MSAPLDVLVVGAGPAGAAAAITAASAGLRVRILERSTFPRHRPGETLHPGVEVLFEQLGVAHDIAAKAGARHASQAVRWRGVHTVTPFGSDEHGTWSGYQVDRAILDAALLDRARVLGVDVCQPESALAPILADGRVVGVQRHAARFVIDAGGGRGWLRRHLRLALVTASRPLRAYYGYCEADGDPVPLLAGDALGWTWTARVAPSRVNWMRLSFATPRKPHAPPGRLAGCPPIGRVRGADVTWRHLPRAAGPGYFVVGDAAMVLDPAASHGVLRALMTGIAAADAIARVDDDDAAETVAGERYCLWLARWFAHDVERLSGLYRQLQHEEVPWQRQ